MNKKTFWNQTLQIYYNFLQLTIVNTCICTVKCTSVCLTDGSEVHCTDRGLQQVPDLPTYATYVDLSNNNITELNETSFSHLEGLQVLILKHQTPGLTIRNNSFRRLSNLTSLQMDYNHALQIEPEAFNGLHHLRTLTLTQCGLDDSVLSGDVLKPLVSLQKLVLCENNIERIRPAPFFINMRSLNILDLSGTNVKSICEEDLLNFQGKHFTHFILSSVKLQEMNQYWSGWDKCGNPLKNMSIATLDLSRNGFEVNTAKRFFDAITGTKIQTLVLSSSSMGSSFGFRNLKNPDRFTFKGLNASSVKMLDLSRSYIFALQFSVFSSLSDLEEITLAQNQINKIDNDAFLGTTSLLKLNLSINYLGAIDSRTFQNLDKLQVLDLSYNHIRVLGYRSFQGLANLLQLNLTANSLESVHEFAILPNLEKLYLGENRITSLYMLPHMAKNLTTLDLEFNKLTDLSDVYTIVQGFPNIEKIFLQGNAFFRCQDARHQTTVVSGKLQLLHLGLSSIEIIWSGGNCLDVFEHLHQLQQLSLSANFLQSLPKNIFKDLTSLTFLDLSFNSLKYLPSGVLPKSLQILNLEYNSIYSVDPHLFGSLTHLSLLQNQFRCDCTLKDFQMWLNESRTILVHPAEDVTCASPEDHYMIPVLSSSIQCEDEEDETNVEKLRRVLFIFCTAFIVLLTAVTIIYIRRRGYVFKIYKRLAAKLVDGKREDPEADGFLYDVYVCFSSGDIKWVEKALLKRLDSQFSDQNVLHCCFEERDFIPGEDHLTNMRNAIQSSRKTLCVVSERFLKDGWCLETFTLAQKKTEEELNDILLVLVVGNIPPYRLLKYKPIRSHIENRRFLVWPDDSQDLQWFYEQLIHNIRQDTKVKRTDDKADGRETEATRVHEDTAV
ncbi:TLR5 [Triplophysa rosa]|uniref:Toll-like receptor 5 n=1 Tax=Triplophysa rosa TaxID=992332 RepID=A0A977J6T6_TRIRA|nr:TLR5 [Triplophysa rosa]UWV86654.1 Toll-like receptor 5.1 [Triplophysa rosa]